MLLTAQHLSYALPSREVLFHDVHLTIASGQKAAIVGPNGIGKSTLLKILAGQLAPASGTVDRSAHFYYVPQHYGQYNHLTVAAAMGVAARLDALSAILSGDTRPVLFDILGDQWNLPEACRLALDEWGLSHITPEQSFAQLSGGEKTKALLAGIQVSDAPLILLDEPTNHLDAATRQQLYTLLTGTRRALLVVSHDRQLLEYCNLIHELQADGLKTYGGNYTFYEEMKATETAAIQQRIAHDEKTLKAARLQQQQAMQRQQRHNAHAHKKGQQGGLPKILLNGRRNKAEGTTAHLKQVHTEKVSGLQDKLQQSSATEQVSRLMKGHFGATPLHQGKIMVNAEGINYAYPGARPLWPEPLDFTITSGLRVAISGNNGSGKSTLLRMIMQQLTPTEGSLYVAPATTLLLDQDYSIVHRNRTVLEQAAAFNETKLEDHMLKTVLVRFLFEKDSWDKPCAGLSGGETLRLALCCMTLQHQAPDIIILDEPANNLDLDNIHMLTQICRDYQGTLITVSHDQTFLEEIGINTEIVL